MSKKKGNKNKKIEETCQLYYNGNQTIDSIAKLFDKSERTIYRWLKQKKTLDRSDPQFSKPKQIRKKRYTQEIIDQIKDLKVELPRRTAVGIQKILKERNKSNIPSESMIRKVIAKEGLSNDNCNNRNGYIVFERSKPNDLWQIDIGGVQTVGHLGKLYLFALLDDCSRYIVSAFYATNEKGFHVIELIRKAVEKYGRPNQILADNGTQFKNVLGDLNTKYSLLLTSIDVQPIFARPHHPQTKGKLERWFGTVNKMYLTEARHYVHEHDSMNLTQFNEMFLKWVDWYNTEKFHRSLPDKCPPAKVFFNKEPRVYRPLELCVDWDKWMSDLQERKVSKTNLISYEGNEYSVPPGYMGMKIQIIRYLDHLALFYDDKPLITHVLDVSLDPSLRKKESRKVATSGTIGYKGKHYTVDYRLRGEAVMIHLSGDNSKLLVYHKNHLIKTINLIDSK